MAAGASDAGASNAGASEDRVAPSAWDQGADAAKLESWVTALQKRAHASIERLVHVKGRRTVDNTLRPYDDAWAALQDAEDQSQLLYGVGAHAGLRDKAQALTQQCAAALAALNLDPRVYRALAAISTAAISTSADEGTRHYLERVLLEYRLAGVDRDAATRAKVKRLQDEITAAGLAFERAVHDDVRSVSTNQSRLAGMPADWIKAHPPDSHGQVTITTDPPDAWPVLDYADSRELRAQVFLQRDQVAYPANVSNLRALLTARADLAHLLGYATWADYAMADQMMKSPAELGAFLLDIEATARGPAEREESELLAFATTRDPSVHTIMAADARYWREQYKRSVFNFDSLSVRPYFPYAAVEAGVIGAASRLFHVGIRTVADVQTWHPSVTSYDVFDQQSGARLGRIFLDMHPREGKDKWFSTAPVTLGLHGRQLPVGALICNFPGGNEGDPGLLQYNDVSTFLHEFGHLMHHIIGGQHRYAGMAAFAVEGDFVEAPSQMLEEFFHDYDVLARFAHHYQSGGTLPRDLYERMIRASAYGRAYGQMQQVLYSNIALHFHSAPPAALDFDAAMRQDFERYNPHPLPLGDHFWASFTHLDGYSSNYYTYVLDKVIALDFFSKFDPRQLMDDPVGLRYRQTVLAPGAAEPAASLIRNFLGRDMNSEAYKRWLLEEFDTAPAAVPAL